MAKKAAKKAKVAPKTPKAVKPKKTTAKFVSLAVTAVIPTQSYGNIQPRIEVQAATYEDARDFVMPLIEQLYAHYGESKPGFLGKVEVSEKVVTPAPAPKVEAPASPSSAPAPAAAPVPSTSTEPAVSDKPKSEAVAKAEKAISLAMTPEAAVLIQDQIEKSVKIAAEDKPALLNLVLKKRGELGK